MGEKERYEISSEGQTKIEAVDSYLAATIREGRPIEALIATKRIGEIANDRTKEAARVATEGSWSWTDVGSALGMTKQAAHEKLRARVHEEIGKGLTRVDRADKAAQEKIARRAQSKRERLARGGSRPESESARKKVDAWEQRQYEKLGRGIDKARDELARAERSVQENLDRKS